MDLSDWVNIRDQSFPSCHFDYEPEIEYTDHYCEFGKTGLNEKACSSFDLILLADDLEIKYLTHDRECEKDLNEKACDIAWKILMDKENAEILKLEEEVTTLEKQLAWADVSWSEIDSIPLSEKVKSLDLSIRSLKNKNSEDGHDCCDGSRLLTELVERWKNILTHLPEKYFDHKVNDLIMKESEMASVQPEPDCMARKKDVSCSTLEIMRKEDEVEEVTKLNIKESAIADLHEIDITVKKIDSSLFTLVTMRKEVVEESIGGIIQDSVSADLQHKIDNIMAKKSFSISIPETSMNEEDVAQECAILGDYMSDASLHVAADPKKLTEQNNFYLSTDFDISISSPPNVTNSSTETKFSGKVKFAGHISDAISSDLSKVSKGTGKNENKGVKMEKNRSDTWGFGMREGPLSGTMSSDLSRVSEGTRKNENKGADSNVKMEKNCVIGIRESPQPVTISSDLSRVSEGTGKNENKSADINVKMEKNRSDTWGTGIREGPLSGTISSDLSKVSEGTGKNEKKGADSNVKMEKNRTDTWGIGIREGQLSGTISSDLSKVSEGTGKNEKKGADSNVKMEKNRTDTWGIGIREGVLSGTLMQDSETLAQFVNKKRGQVSKMNLKDRKNKKAKLVSTNHEPFSDVSLKAKKPKPKYVFIRKEKVEHALYDLQNQSVNSASKPILSPNKPAIKQESTLVHLDLAHTISLPTNSTESSSVESLCSAITDARMEETPEVLPFSRLSSAAPGFTNLESKTIIELKDLAKGMNVRGCSKLTKSKLVEKLRLELATRVNCTE